MKELLQKRPLSWSSISAFAYDPDQWYKKYFLNEKTEENMAMNFGKKFAKSIENRKPMVPVEIYSHVEYPLKVVFNDIPLIGFIDTYEPHTKLREYKTARTLWTQKKADIHGQLKMYALMLYIQHKVLPHDLTIHLDCIQTKEDGDFGISLVDSKVHSFEVKVTMKDISVFGEHILNTVKEMEKFVNQKLSKPTT